MNSEISARSEVRVLPRPRASSPAMAVTCVVEMHSNTNPIFSPRTDFAAFYLTAERLFESRSGDN